MCYEDKVGSVADAISGLVQFDCVEEARKYCKSYLLPETAPIALQIRETAEHVIANATRYGVAHLLDGELVAHRTLISTAEEAIRLCAQRYMEHSESSQTADLGTSRREAIPVPA